MERQRRREKFRMEEEATRVDITTRRRARSELPMDPRGDGVTGIKVRFERAEDKYPATIELLMTDGEWVKYQIFISQPPKIATDEREKEGAWETGYKPRRKRRR